MGLGLGLKVWVISLFVEQKSRQAPGFRHLF